MLSEVYKKVLFFKTLQDSLAITKEEEKEAIETAAASARTEYRRKSKMMKQMPNLQARINESFTPGF